MMRKVLFSALLMTLFFTLSCGGEKFALPEAPEENDGTIAVSDTTYIQLTPVWEPATGYAKLILSKHYGNSPTTITDWVKAYRKHAKPKKQKK